MYKILILFFFHFLLSQSINHEPIKNIKENSDIKVEVFIDLQASEIKTFDLYYKNSSQDGYFKQNFFSDDDIYFYSNIPSNFVIDKDIYYYILLETETNILTSPQIDPQLNPFRINVLKEVVNNNEFTYENKISNVNIISPEYDENVLPENFIISVSYYEYDNLNIDSIKVFLDDIDITSETNIKQNYLIYIPQKKINSGLHKVKILIPNKENSFFNPIIWTFNIVEKYEKQNFNYFGKLWTDFTGNEIDGLNTSYNTSNFNFTANTEWMDFNLKSRYNSLDNDFEQSKNRYSLRMKNKFLVIDYGDFYPQFDQLSLNGNRVRGIGFNFNSNFIQLNLVKGELNRAVQGSANEAFDLSYSTEYSEEQQQDFNQLNISRSGYTFQNELSGLRIGFGREDKINWGLNLVKVKDNISSVSSNINGAIINLDAITNQFSSDQFIDFNDNDFFDSDDLLYLDTKLNGNDGVWDDAQFFNNINEFLINEVNTVLVGYCIDNPDEEDICDNCYEDSCPIKQNIISIEIYEENLDYVLNQVNLFNDLDINLNYLDDNWFSGTPKDNLVLGTDFKVNSNKFKVNGSIAFSTLNDNIWYPVTTKNELDTILDEFEDCFVGRTYSNEFPDDYYWLDCTAYDINGSEIPLIYNELGASLEDFPDPEDLSDLMHFNPVNMIPNIPSFFNDEYDSKFSDILNYPEVSYDFNIRLNYPNQNFYFGIKKVGSEFNSFANSYLQSDTQEKFINNRFKLLNNRMYLSLNWKSINNGLSSDISSSNSDKYDLIISYYPRKNLPNLNLNYGLYDKNSGLYFEEIDNNLGFCDDEAIITENECPNNQWNQNENYGSVIDITDNRIITQTNNISLTLSQNLTFWDTNHNFSLSVFKSDTDDILYKDRILENIDYVSPQSTSNNTNFLIKSYINSFLSTDFYFSNSEYTFSNEISSAFQEQDVVITRLGINYNNNKIIEKIGTSIDYSSGDGTTPYNQYGLKLLLDLKFSKNLLMNINMRYYNRSIPNDADYKNSIIKANLSYNF